MKKLLLALALLVSPAWGADYYTASGDPAEGSALSSSVIRAEYTAIQTAFGKIAGYTSAGTRLIFINSGGTAQTTDSALTYNGTTDVLTVNTSTFGLNTSILGTLGVTGVATLTAQPILSSLTASLPVFTDASKGLVSNAMTGTGNVVMSASPTLTGTITAAAITNSGLITANAGVSVPTAQNVTGAGTAQVTGFATVSATTLTGTLSTAAQPNVTSLGTLTSLGVTGALTAGTVNGNTITTGTGTLTLGALKVATISNTLTLTATDGSTLAIGTGGTLGTAAYTASTAYQAADADLTTWAGITPGTGVGTALAVNVGTAGSFITNGGALGSPSSAGTMPAFTLGGAISGGGNQINNVVIGASTPLAGSFTTGTFSASPLLLNVSSGTPAIQISNAAGGGGVKAELNYAITSGLSQLRALGQPGAGNVFALRTMVTGAETDILTVNYLGNVSLDSFALSAGAISGTTGGFSGLVTRTVPAATNTEAIRITGSTTGAVYNQFVTTGGSYIYGVENSIGNTFGATAYAFATSVPAGRKIENLVNAVVVSSTDVNGINGVLGGTTPAAATVTTLTASGAVDFGNNIMNTANGQKVFNVGSISPRYYSGTTDWGINNQADTLNLITITNAGAITIPGTLGVTGATTLSSTLTITNIASDATHTDATVCVDTTSKTLYSGSGVAGICLGTSSERYKNGIAPLQKGLAEVLALQPVSYRLNQTHGDPAKVLYGFTAEQGGAVLPQLMGLDIEGRPNTFDYLGVVPVLVRATQEIDERLRRLEAANESRYQRVANN